LVIHIPGQKLSFYKEETEMTSNKEKKSLLSNSFILSSLICPISLLCSQFFDSNNLLEWPKKRVSVKATKDWQKLKDLPRKFSISFKVIEWFPYVKPWLHNLSATIKVSSYYKFLKYTRNLHNELEICWWKWRNYWCLHLFKKKQSPFSKLFSSLVD